MAIRDEVLNGLQDKLGLDNLNESSRLQDLGIDSLDVVEYLLEIEETYNIEFPPEEMQNLSTLGDLIRIIESKVN